MFGLNFRKKDQPKNLALETRSSNSFFAPTAGAGSVITEDSAMRITAVYACVRIIAEGIASTPLHMYRHRLDGGKDRAALHPLSLIFGGIPNEENTTQEVLEYLIASLLLSGNAYSEVIRDNRGQIISINPLDASAMTPVRDEAGVLSFEYKPEGGESIVYRKQQLWRICGLSKDGVNGYSPITQAREALGVAKAAELHASKTFTNGTSYSGVFEMDGALSDEGFERLKESLQGSAAANMNNMMKPLILEDGLSYNPISMTLQDAQFIESRQFQIAEIARMYSVPLHKLSDLTKSSFSNIEHQSLELVRDTFRPWCTRIEQTIRRDLLTVNERPQYFARFNLEGLLRGDTKTRYEAHASALVNGWMTRNEVRSIEDLNTADGLDEFLVPAHMSQDMEAPESDPVSEIEARQVSVIRRELGRADFDDWAEDYYSRLAVSLTGDDCDKETAEAYCADRLKKLMAADDVAELLNKWENK